MYFITTIHSKDENSIDTRCIGYFEELETAKIILENNACDLFEALYEYAVIEEVEEGLYQLPKKEYWFEINKTYDGYVAIEKPSKFKGWAVFGIG